MPQYLHSTVNHSDYFVDPFTGVNTYVFESYWYKAKQRIKAAKNLDSRVMNVFLYELMWKNNEDKENWDNLFDLLKQ